MSTKKGGWAVQREDGSYIARMPRDDGSRIWTMDKTDIRIWSSWSEAAAAAAMCGGDPVQIPSRR